MVNKLFQLVRRNKKSEARRAKEGLLEKQGREQLSKLNERGLDLPVALL